MARVSIEDCKKNMPNCFALVIVAANRARQLMGNSTPLINSKNKEVVIALREIAEGKVIMKGDLGLAESGDQNSHRRRLGYSSRLSASGYRIVQKCPINRSDFVRRLTTLS